MLLGESAKKAAQTAFSLKKIMVEQCKLRNKPNLGKLIAIALEKGL